MKELTFPKGIKSKNEKLSPLMKFFNSLARRIDKSQVGIKKIDVSSVKINPTDAKALKKEIKKWCKTTVLKHHSNSYIDDQISWMWLEVGPAEDKTVPKGKCIVNTSTLFINRSE